MTRLLLCTATILALSTTVQAQSVVPAGRRERMGPLSAPAARDRFVPKRSATLLAARRHLLSDAEKFSEESS
jgi:hypothetical protein